MNKIIKNIYGDKWTEFLKQNEKEIIDEKNLQKRGIKKVDFNDFDFKWMKLIVDIYFKQNPQILVQIKINLKLLKDAEKLVDKIKDNEIRDISLKDIVFGYLKIDKNVCNMKGLLRLSERIFSNAIALEILYG